MSNIINFTLHTDDQISEINNKANLLKKNKLDLILAELNLLRDIVKEQKNEIKYLKTLTKDLKETKSPIGDLVSLWYNIHRFG